MSAPEWFACQPKSRTETLDVPGVPLRRSISWRGQVGRLAGNPRMVWCCAKSHRIKRSAVECAEREARRRNKGP